MSKTNKNLGWLKAPFHLEGADLELVERASTAVNKARKSIEKTSELLDDLQKATLDTFEDKLDSLEIHLNIGLDFFTRAYFSQREDYYKGQADISKLKSQLKQLKEQIND